MIIGSGGAGKSTLARQLEAILDLTLSPLSLRRSAGDSSFTGTYLDCLQSPTVRLQKQFTTPLAVRQQGFHDF